MIQSHFLVLLLLLIVSEITELQTEWVIQTTGVLSIAEISNQEYFSVMGIYVLLQGTFFSWLCIEVVISFFPAVAHLYWRLGKLAVVWAIQCGQYRDLYSHHSVQGPDSITYYQGSAAQWSAEASKDLIRLGKNNMSNLNCCLFMN